MRNSFDIAITLTAEVTEQARPYMEAIKVENVADLFLAAINFELKQNDQPPLHRKSCKAVDGIYNHMPAAILKFYGRAKAIVKRMAEENDDENPAAWLHRQVSAYAAALHSFHHPAPPAKRSASNEPLLH